jgi:hypothetical protein
MLIFAPRNKESKMNKNHLIALIAVPCLLISCAQKKQHDDIIVQQTETPKPQSPIRMQDYKDVKDVQWLGKQYQVEVSRTADDSLRMVKDENGQKFVDNRITLKVIRADGSEFCSKSFTKANASSSTIKAPITAASISKFCGCLWP